MRTAEGNQNAIIRPPYSLTWITDFETCENMQQLEEVMSIINRNQYQLISVTQDSFDVYRVFFRRCVLE